MPASTVIVRRMGGKAEYAMRMLGDMIGKDIEVRREGNADRLYLMNGKGERK